MPVPYTLAFPYCCLGEHESKCNTYWGRIKLPFCRRPFQTYLLVWQLLKFDSNFTESCSIRSNEHQTSFCSDNGLEQSMRPTVICILSWPSLLTHICVTRPGWSNLNTRMLCHMYEASNPALNAHVTTIAHLKVSCQFIQHQITYNEITEIHKLYLNCRSSLGYKCDTLPSRRSRQSTFQAFVLQNRDYSGYFIVAMLSLHKTPYIHTCFP